MSAFTRRNFLKAATIPAASLVSGCLGGDDPVHPIAEPISEWPSFRGDPANTGYALGVEDTSTDPDIEWTFSTEDSIWASPVVSDDVLFIGSSDHSLYALDAGSGDFLWDVETENRVEATPAVSDGTVVVGSFDRHVYGIDAASGDIMWDIETGGLIRSSATIVDGTVYVGSGCHNLACEWYADGDVDETGVVYALDLETGDIEWEHPIEDEVVSTPAVHDGSVYIGASNGVLYALDATEGDERWVYDDMDMIWGSPSFAYDTVYLGDWDGLIHAVDAGSGEDRWVFDTGGDYVSASTAVDDDYVFIGMTPENQFGDTDINRAELFAIERDTGEEAWAYETDALEIGSSPLVTDERVYFGTHAPSDAQGTGMLALTREGELEWFFDADERGVGSSPALVDGMLYFGGTDGIVYALA